MGTGASLGTIASGLLIAAFAITFYLAWLLPRLPRLASLLLSAAAIALLLVLSQRGSWINPLVGLLAATAVLAGHAGWLLGRTPARSVLAGAAVRPSSGRQPRASTPRTGPSLLSDVPPVVVAPPTGDRPESPVTPATALPPSDMFRPARAGVAIADVARTSLGRYLIDRVIGRGSMGVVYLGQDPMLGRQVAIKTLALGREFAGSELEDVKQRFFREAETAGRLQHRDIVTIYDVGEENDLAFIAMEFLKGYDLQRHVQPQKLLPVPVVLRVGTRVAEALAYAHSRGVVHRDVKPANVMLHLPSGAVKVTDFGIARVSDASRTRTGTVLGTPSFMSPEHLAGRSIDGRSDLYSLGVMLYQLLTGELPLQAESMARLMNRIANDAPADVRELRPELPEALALLLTRALHKAPAERHADGLQMAAELRAIELALARQSRVGLPAAAAADAVPGSPFAATVRIAR